ncbi:MAG: DUF2480 family protein [Candidatus Marinimicrobia bacterium]|nr:DUF2480 family protein [Candidatus Neomarinimicrobiota bacterium]
MGVNLETIRLDDFLSDGLIREKPFRKMVNDFDWSIYKNKKVIIKGCGSVPIPTWAYLIIASKLVSVVSQIFYGEPCSAIKIYSKD